MDGMSMEQQQAYQKLVECLEQEISVLRHLLDVVRNEKDCLLRSQLEDLKENNKSKETMLMKIRSLEGERESLAILLAHRLNYKSKDLKLLDLAKECLPEQGERLRVLHTTMTLLMTRIKDFNLQNEALAQAALRTMNGVIHNLQKDRGESTVYQKKGKVETSNVPGALVSREA